MVAGIVLPDVTGAMIAYLRADADLTALCTQVPSDWEFAPPTTPRISASFPETSDKARRWPMPHYAILLRRAGGPPTDLETGRRFARFDMMCYGPGATSGIRARTADQLWRTLDPVLNPPPGMPMSFHQSGVEVIGVYAESDPIPGIEPGTDWRRVIASYVVEYMSRPVP